MSVKRKTLEQRCRNCTDRFWHTLCPLYKAEDVVDYLRACGLTCAVLSDNTYSVHTISARTVYTCTEECRRKEGLKILKQVDL